MAKRVQFIRHTTPQADAFEGLAGEITVDTDNKELRVHDGLQKGGFAQARKDLANVVAATTSNDGKMTSAQVAQLAQVISGLADTLALDIQTTAPLSGGADLGQTTPIAISKATTSADGSMPKEQMQQLAGLPVLLSTKTVTAATASVSFTSTDGINAGNYRNYIIEIPYVQLTTLTDRLVLRLSQSGVFDTGATNYLANMMSDSTLLGAKIANYIRMTYADGYNAYEAIIGDLKLYLGDSANGRNNNLIGKTMYTNAGSPDHLTHFGGGLKTGSASAQEVDGIQFLTDTGGTIKAGQFKLYGVP